MAFLVGGIGLGAACASKAGGEAASDAAPPDAFRATGCATAPTHPVAPGGYYVDGKTPLPGPDPLFPFRTVLAETCPGGPTPIN